MFIYKVLDNIPPPKIPRGIPLLPLGSYPDFI